MSEIVLDVENLSRGTAVSNASFQLRKTLGEQTTVPDPAWALAEDAATLSSSLALSKAPKERRPGRYAGPKPSRSRMPHDL